MKDSLVYQVQQLLKLNKINIDKEELAFQIKSHPSYPSLHAITGVLDHFNINNLALDVPVREETLSKLPKAFLAQVETGQDKKFAIVYNNGLTYKIIDDLGKKSTKSLSEFLSIFTGIIVAVEKDEGTQEVISKKPVLNSVLITILSALILTLFILQKPSLPNNLLFILSLIGIYISAAIFKQEQGEESLLGNAFCSDENEKKSCDAVLNSKGANIFNTFKISDLSLIYFSGFTISIFALTIANKELSLVFLVSVMALPITLYSIFYQAIILKKWCFLCLCIVGVIWTQSAIALLNFEIIYPSLSSTISIGLSFTLSFTIWQYLKPLLESKKELKITKINHYKFKRNFNLFNTLLQQSKTIDTSIENKKELVFGNKNAPLNITVITSPFCGHCKSVHTLIENIINAYKDSVKITIRIAANTKSDNDLLKITTRLLEIYHTKGQDVCFQAMHDIYGPLNAEQWFNKWDFCKNSETYIETIEKQSEWSNSHNINFTPEILINGRAFPKDYDRSDLIYFIEDLHEDCCQLVTVNTSMV